MTKNELDMLKIDIREIQIENISAKIMMLKEYFSLLFNILIKKGFSDNYLKELNKAKFEYMQILTEENHLLGLILKDGLYKDFDAVNHLIIELNDLSDKTIIYYYRLIDDIEKELEINRNYSYRRITKNFDTLIENEEFKLKVLGLNLTIEDIKDYLKYEDNFWNYISDKTKVIKNPYINYNSKIHYYGVWYDLNQDNKLKKLVICVPDVIDLKTAQIAIHEFKHAHDVYTGNFFKDSILEETAKLEENKFKYEYLKRKN